MAPKTEVIDQLRTTITEKDERIAELETYLKSETKDKESAQESFGTIWSKWQRCEKRIAQLEHQRDELLSAIAKESAERDAVNTIAKRQSAILTRTGDELADCRVEIAALMAERDTRIAQLERQRDELLGEREKLTDVFATIGITSGLYDDEQDALKAACDTLASVKGEQ